MKVGDTVVITEVEEPYFHVGDKATIIEKCNIMGTPGCWIGNFTINEKYHGGGIHHITPGFAKCELVEEN